MTGASTSVVAAAGDALEEVAVFVLGAHDEFEEGAADGEDRVGTGEPLRVSVSDRRPEVALLATARVEPPSGAPSGLDSACG